MSDSTCVSRLSPREVAILVLLAQGKTSQEIASAISIAKNTVDTHRRHIISKLQCRNTREAVHKAIREGWLVV